MAKIIRIVIEECVSRYDVRGETETGYAQDIHEVYKTNPDALVRARWLAQEMAGKHGLTGYEYTPLPTKQETVQKYPDGSTVLVNGAPWTIIDMSRDSEGLLPGQVDRGEDYNLYRLSRHNDKTLLRWQHELDVENAAVEEQR